MASSTSSPSSPEIVYPLDYVHLKGTTTTDGRGVDLFQDSAAGEGLVGAYLTVDLGKADLEAKLLINCTPAEIDLMECSSPTPSTSGPPRAA